MLGGSFQFRTIEDYRRCREIEDETAGADQVFRLVVKNRSVISKLVYISSEILVNTGRVIKVDNVLDLAGQEFPGPEVLWVHGQNIDIMYQHCLLGKAEANCGVDAAGDGVRQGGAV